MTGAPVEAPAPAAATRAHGSVHIDVGTVEHPLFVSLEHDSKVGVQLCWGGDLNVWLSGTPDELHRFAHRLHQLANQAAAELVRAPSPDVEEPATLPKVDEERVA